MGWQRVGYNWVANILTYFNNRKLTLILRAYYFFFPLSLNSFCIYCIFPLFPSLNVVNLTLCTVLILPSEQRPNIPSFQDWCLQTAYSWVPSRTPQPKEVVLSKATLPPGDITYPKSSWYRGTKTLASNLIFLKGHTNFRAFATIGWAHS